MLIARQGDVGIIKREDVDITEAKKVSLDGEDIILAEGEATGHAHRVAARCLAALYVLEQARLLHVEKPTKITHEEHNEIILEPGVYEVVQQREYTPERIRPVLD